MAGDGKFYLGRELSGKDKKPGDRYLYQSHDLNTHAVVFGMTGSGKTGLCIDLIEEAISEDIPLVIIDPKGDVANLALLFPQLQGSDFQPWISPADAKKAGQDISSFAEKTAGSWQKGLKEWGIGSEHISMVKENMDLRIFTPGSSAGLPINVVEGFKKPEHSFDQDEEGMIEKIKNSVSALLALLEIDNDPLKSKPHILLASIIEHFWRIGRSITLEELILYIQKPPIKKLGVFSVDQLIDEKERIELAFKINNIIASSSFRFWNRGIPLSAGELYKKKGSKVPVNIFYIAHLGENERMFIVSLLLNEIVYWIRTQKGSPDLKYLLYMDEIYGYLPPYPRNPPSKKPFMILMKQARAFGLGVVLVTQNPKDIDYKALTNTGSWFIGKLQAEGDIERVMEGFRGIITAAGETVAGPEVKKKITSLRKREFLVKNIHEKGMKIFSTRWAMSFLAGPLTREQIKVLVKDKELPLSGHEQPKSDRPPKTPENLHQQLMPLQVPVDYLFEDQESTNNFYYSPYFLMQGEVVFDDSRIGLYVRKKVTALAPVHSSPEWTIEDEKISVSEYSAEPASEVQGYEPLEINLNYKSLRKILSSFKDFLFSRMILTIYNNHSLKLISEESETEDNFRQRCRDVVEKIIDKEIEKVKSVNDHRVNRLEDNIAREKLRVEELKDQLKSKKTEEIISIGESVLGLLLGSKSTRGLSSAARRRRRTTTAANKLEQKKTKLSQLEEDIQSLKEELEDKIADIEDEYYARADQISELDIRLEKDDIIVPKHYILWKLKEQNKNKI